MASALGPALAFPDEGLYLRGKKKTKPKGLADFIHAACQSYREQTKAITSHLSTPLASTYSLLSTIYLLIYPLPLIRVSIICTHLPTYHYLSSLPFYLTIPSLSINHLSTAIYLLSTFYQYGPPAYHPHPAPVLTVIYLGSTFPSTCHPSSPFAMKMTALQTVISSLSASP